MSGQWQSQLVHEPLDGAFHPRPLIDANGNPEFCGADVGAEVVDVTANQVIDRVLRGDMNPELTTPEAQVEAERDFSYLERPRGRVPTPLHDCAPSSIWVRSLRITGAITKTNIASLTTVNADRDEWFAGGRFVHHEAASHVTNCRRIALLRGRA